MSQSPPMTIEAIAPPLKWHGGKHYLADRIIALMPPHVHYVEPFPTSGQRDQSSTLDDRRQRDCPPDHAPKRSARYRKRPGGR